jgi:ferredoxin
LESEIPQATESGGAQIVDVVVEPDLCMRFMNCMRIARRAFKPDKDSGKSTAPGWRDVDPALLWQAGRSCPSGAIRIVTERGSVKPRWQETDAWSMDKHPAASRPHDKSRDPYKGMI